MPPSGASAFTAIARSNCAEPNGRHSLVRRTADHHLSYSQGTFSYTVGLATTLPDGAEIPIFDAVSG
jgi:hypothetical protein